MINVIKEIMFDCAYENVVQTEITFEEKVYNLNIFKHREVESQIFIVLQILESQLVAQDNYKDLVIEIANYLKLLIILEKMIYMFRIWIKIHR